LTPAAQGRVLFVLDEENVATRYRWQHQAEQLASQSLASEVVRSDELEHVADPGRYDAVILVRVEWSERVASFAERVRASGRPLVFDTDDLLFEPELTEYLSFARTWPARDLEALTRKRARYRQTLEACDRATVSTAPLATHARRHVPHVAVTHNAVSREMIDLADSVLGARRTKLRRLRRRVTSA